MAPDERRGRLPLLVRPSERDRRPVALRPGLSLLACLAGAAALLWLSTVTGSVRGFTVIADAAPLAVAGGPAPAVVGYLEMGLVRVYVPWTILPTLALGELLVRRGIKGRLVMALGLGLAGAGQLLVLSGCGCGAGGVKFLAPAAAGLA